VRFEVFITETVKTVVFGMWYHMAWG